MRAHCHACARPTEVRNYDNVRACCSDCLTPYRDDAAVWEVPPVVATPDVVTYYPDTPEVRAWWARLDGDTLHVEGTVTAPAKAKEVTVTCTAPAGFGPKLIIGDGGKTEWTTPCAHCGMSFDAADNPIGGHVCRGYVETPAGYSDMRKPPWPDDRTLVREQARALRRQNLEIEALKKGLTDQSMGFYEYVKGTTARLAWALFCLETMAEVTRIAEGQGTEHEVRLVMWARTRTEIRDRCLARAVEVANWMVFDPREVAS